MVIVQLLALFVGLKTSLDVEETPFSLRGRGLLLYILGNNKHVADSDHNFRAIVYQENVKPKA